jgi:hypothetical protein
MSQHGLENKISKVHTALLAKVEDKGDVYHCFDQQGVMHKEFLESKLNIQVLKRLRRRFQHVRP